MVGIDREVGNLTRLPVTGERQTQICLVHDRERRLEAGAELEVRSTRLHVEVLDHPHAFTQTDRILDFKGDAPPEALDENTREDVPSAHVRSFAIALAVGTGLARAPHLAHRRILGVEENGAQQHLDSVRALLELLRHVEATFDQHVLGFTDLFAVQEDVRKRVDAAEDQRRATAGLHIHRRCVEGLRVEPLVGLVRTQLHHVEANFHRRQQPRVHQIEFAIPGHRRLHRLHTEVGGKRQRAYRTGIRLREIVQLPFAVKADGHHAKHLGRAHGHQSQKRLFHRFSP